MFIRKKMRKKNSKNKKEGFSSIDFEVRSSFIAHIVYHIISSFCSSKYNARRWIMCVCMFCMCFLVLLHYWFSKSRRRMEEE